MESVEIQRTTKRIRGGDLVGLRVRSRRYALLADDGVVKVFNLEEGGAFTMSSAEDMLVAL
ncbi:hypothetical protein QJS04_geneDACA006720 [Acorus gramineus]|uniref:Uncharacterized protein n=1 Tax=Acorus gramineus TaxID=55184 RepID=A0AAV9AZ32_ACOGR|nr:hypothetical protein QJS04_geneDACA006720 [Acorus gramineus]